MALRFALAGAFSNTSRTRGEAYAAEGRVTILASTPNEITASVQGSDTYTVTIARDRSKRESFVASCDCPHFLDHLVPCKHIWATLLEAEDEGLFGDPSDPHPGAELALHPGSAARSRTPGQLAPAPPRPQTPADRFLALLRPLPALDLE